MGAEGIIDGIDWRVADATAMTSADIGTFSAVIDKGTYHALSTRSSNPDGKHKALLLSIAGVLEEGGVFVSITIVPPHSVQEELALAGNWTCATHSVRTEPVDSLPLMERD